MDLSKPQKFDRKDCLNWKFIAMIILHFIFTRSSNMNYFIYLIRTNFRGHLISRIWNTNISRALIFAILQKMTNLGHLISRKLTKDRPRKPVFLLIDHLNND